MAKRTDTRDGESGIVAVEGNFLVIPHELRESTPPELREMVAIHNAISRLEEHIAGLAEEKAEPKKTLDLVKEADGLNATLEAWRITDSEVGLGQTQKDAMAKLQAGRLQIIRGTGLALKAFG